MEVVHEDTMEVTTQCTNHPYKNSTPGGICAFCLQEKLGKLVSSSFPLPIFPSSSSPPSSPSHRSDSAAAATTTSAAATNTKRSRLPFRKKKKKKKKKEDNSTSIVFKRSKSMHFLGENFSDDFTPDKKGFFWSFLHTSKHSKKSDKNLKDLNFTPTAPTTVCGPNVGSSSRERKGEDFVENGSERKVARSRSVGCGSRSFSGDFFERISTGFGDCTLRRVESQREGKSKVQPVHRKSGSNGVNGQDCIKERVRCGGIFSGFIVTSSSSSSSSSSTGDNKVISSHGRSKSWGRAFASPMRAFGKGYNGKRDVKNGTTPNLGAVPSSLAVSG